MEELKKLIKTLEEVGRGSSSALLNYNDTDNLETRLYQLVKATDDLDENGAVLLLYGSSRKADAFKMLKSRVKKKLYNQLHFLDFDNIRKYTKLRTTEIKCNTLLNEALILNQLDVSGLRERLITQALKLAKEAGLTSAIVRALELKRLYYSYDVFDQKKYRQVADEIIYYYELQYKEEKAKTLYYNIIVDVRLGVKNRAEKLEYINQATMELFRLWKETSSSFIFSRYYVAKTAVLEVVGDNQALLMHLLESEKAYNNGEINPFHFEIQRNQYALTYAYLKSKQYTEGLSVAESLRTEMNPLLPNWFAHMENYFLLAIHSGDFTKAKAILTEVYANTAFGSNVQPAKERWYLFNEFFTLICPEKALTIPEIKLQYIVQDKNGYNVWLVMLEHIKCLAAKDAELIAYQVERLRKYANKYFGKNTDIRTKLFLKLLLIAGHEFRNTKVCRRKGAYILNKLQQTPIAGDAYAETEIIPYEDLWDILLQKLSGVK